MKKIKLTSKQIITWICINYGLFLLGYFTLGFGSGIRAILIANFILDVALCLINLILNIILFSGEYKTPIAGKIGLLFATLLFAAFTYYAFLMPENGMPPVLFG